MGAYLLIESRDPFESADIGFCRDLGRSLRAAGNGVCLFLVQNGVLAARIGAADPGFAALTQAGIEVLADEFSLRERGIPAGRLRAEVKAAALDGVIDRLAEGAKAIWH